MTFSRGLMLEAHINNLQIESDHCYAKVHVHKIIGASHLSRLYALNWSLVWKTFGFVHIYNLSILKYELNCCLNSYIANYKDVNKIQKIKNIYNSRKEIRKIKYNFIKK